MSGTAIALFMVGVLLAALTPRWLARLVGVVLLFAALVVGGELLSGVAMRRAHPECLGMATCKHDPVQHAAADAEGERCLAPKGAR